MAHQPDTRSGSEGEGATLTAPSTIAAVATPPGRGGIGVVRVSGRAAPDIARGVLGRVPDPRHATLADFRSGNGGLIDRGIALYFPAPGSYTGEDVLELQGHGGPFVMSQLLARCVELGARLAEPGEFTRRAYLNDRLDLAQAESVADLIEASSTEAARSAARSLAGEFSRRVHGLAERLVDLRTHVEACIDFPEEEIDPADRAAQSEKLAVALRELDDLREQARQGVVLRDGLVVVLIGRPNVGKSSLLNRLAGEDLAIVTPIPGTTRDYVRATLSLEGVPVHLIDTAGLRDTGDEVERIGVERAWRAAMEAGAALFVTDGTGNEEGYEAQQLARLPQDVAIAHVVNKIDLTGEEPGRDATEDGRTQIRVSAKTGAGIGALRAWLLETAGWKPHGEGIFMARARHLRALEEAKKNLSNAAGNTQAFELFAEDLRIAHLDLSRITGAFGADDLLGEIFGRFCIGK